jgi:hypothetical protein
MDIPAHCFRIVHPGKPAHPPVVCDDRAWPEFSALGWVRQVIEDAKPAPVVDAPPAPVEAAAPVEPAPAPAPAKPARASSARKVKEPHGAFG